MQNKLLVITLFVISTLLVTLQHNAKQIRNVVNPQAEVPVLTVNINQASATEIAEVLIGIGLSKANAIVTYRETNGPFKSLEELSQVKGIGSKTLEKNRNKITF